MEIRKKGPLVIAKEGEDDVFEHLFKTHFKGMHAYACTLLRDNNLAEEMVQVVFVKLYEKAGHIHIETSLEAYLYRAIYNECMNHRKHEKVRSKYQAFASHHLDRTNPHTENSTHKELQAGLEKAMNELPQQCRTIFQLSRFEGLKYLEIAHRLGISVKTVDNQMGKALRVLRLKLTPFLQLILLFLLNL